jgi:hypothetical protein
MATATATPTVTATDRRPKGHLKTTVPAIAAALARREALYKELSDLDEKLAADLDEPATPTVDYHQMAAAALAKGQPIPDRPTGRTTRDNLWERRKIVMAAAGIAEAERRHLVDEETVRFLRETAKERHALAAGIGDALAGLLEATRRQDAYRASMNERGYNVLLVDLTNAFPSEHLEAMTQRFRDFIGPAPRK